MHVYGELSGVLTPAGTISGSLSKPQTLSGELTLPETPAEGSATVSGSATINPILSVNDEGVITATVDTTLSVTPDVVPGLITVGTPGPLVLSGNTEYQMYKRTSDDLTVSGQAVTAPNGYYPEDATKTVPIILKPTVLRPDAQLVQSFTFDQYAVADLELTIPAYTTTAKTIMASAKLSPTISVDTTTHSFFVVERFLTIPEYSVSSKAKGRHEYTYCVYIYELARVPENTIKTIVDPTKMVTSATNIISSLSSYRLLYWSSGSAIALYASNGYGCYQTPTAPSISGTTLTIKSPALALRGSTTYFTSTYMNALTDIRYQYIIDVYKAPKEAMSLDGWITNSLVNHIIDCVNSSTHKLT